MKNKFNIEKHTKYSVFLIVFILASTFYKNTFAQNSKNVTVDTQGYDNNKRLLDTVYHDLNFFDSLKNFIVSKSILDFDTITSANKDSDKKDLTQEALFEVRDDFGCMGDSISIENKSFYNNLLQYIWNLGTDAEPKQHIGYNPPKVYYSSVGNKTIDLQIVNSAKDTISSYISTIAIIPKPYINNINLPFICANSTSFAQIELSGSAPFTIEYFQKNKELQKIIYEDTFSLFCHSTDTIIFSSLEDNFCKSNIYDTIIPDEYPEFTATLSGEVSIYETDSAALKIELSGIPPWNILLSNNTYYSNITENPFICFVNKSDEYYLKSASDQNCKGSTFGKINIKYLGYEYAEISGLDTICEGDTGTVKINLGGKAPWNIAIEEPNETKYISNINTNPYIHKCTQEGIYKILFANDGENKNLKKIGSAQIYQRKKPDFTIAYSGKNCIENPKLLEINVKHEIFPLHINITSGLESQSYILEHEKSIIIGFFDGLNSIDRVSDSVCNFQSNYEFTIKNQKKPSASLKIDSIISATDSTILEANFQGRPPFYFSLNDGSAYDSISTQKFKFIKTNSGEYEISTFHDSSCAGSTWGKARVTLINKPLATLEGGGYYCSEDSIPQIYALVSGKYPLKLAYTLNNDTIEIDSIFSQGIKISTTNNDNIKLISIIDSSGNKGIAEDSIFIKAYPLANIQFQKEYFVCQNQKATAEFQFTGTPPWSFRINNVEYKTNNQNYKIDSLTNGKYIISNFADVNCTYKFIDTITISEYPKTWAQISDKINFTDDTAINLSINFKGTAPWRLDYIYNDKLNEYSGSKDSLHFSLLDGYYKFSKVSDNHCFTELNSSTYIHVHTSKNETELTKKGNKNKDKKPNQTILKMVDIYNFNLDFLSLKHKQIKIEFADSNKNIQIDSTNYILNKNTGIYGPKIICDHSDIRYWTYPLPNMQCQWDIKNGSVKKGKKSFSSILSFDKKYANAELSLKKINRTKIADTIQNKLEINFYKHKVIELDTVFDLCDKNLKISIKNYNPKSIYYWKINTSDKITNFVKENTLINISKAGNYTITINEKCNINCKGNTKTIEFTAPENANLQFNIPEDIYTGVEFPINYDYSKIDKIKYLGDINYVAQFFRSPDTIYFTAHSSGTHNLILQYTEKNKDCIHYTTPTSIKIRQLPLFVISGLEKVCVNDENKYTISNASQYKVKWELPSNTKIEIQNNDSVTLIFNQAETTIIRALIYDTMIANFPIAEIEKKIISGNPSKNTISGDRTACILNFPFKYSMIDTVKELKWQTNATRIDSTENSIFLKFPESKNYFLKVESINEYNCQSKDSINIYAVKTPLIGKKRVIENCFAKNKNLEYIADNEYSYFEIDSIKLENNKFNFKERDILLCHYSDSLCVGTDTISILDTCLNEILIAKTFSIHQKEIQENLILKCANDSLISFKIMTNAGLVLFKSKNQYQKWDGLYRKKAVELGFYPWELKYKNWKGEIITKTGKIEIID